MPKDSKSPTNATLCQLIPIAGNVPLMAQWTQYPRSEREQMETAVPIPDQPEPQILPPPQPQSVLSATGFPRGAGCYLRLMAKGETLGPLPPSEVENLIQSRSVGMADMVWDGELQRWVMLSESRQFAAKVMMAVALARMQSSTCPNCQAQMVVISKQPTGPTLLIVVGILTSIAVIGIALIIAGLIWRRRARRLTYVCPRCNYKT